VKFIRKDQKRETPPDAILTSDWHIREDTPECRTDDFMATQERKLKWLSDLQEKFKCPIFDGGDLFDHWKPTPYLLQWTIKRMPKDVWTVPGNHDLAQHSMDVVCTRDGLAVLLANGHSLHTGRVSWRRCSQCLLQGMEHRRPGFLPITSRSVLS